jgi:hypothetical protein
MMRLVAAGLLVLILCPCTLLAAEIQGKLKSVDAAKSTITLTVDEKDRVFAVPKKTEFLVHDIRDYTPEKGLKDPIFKRKGVQITITTEKKGGKEVVKKIVVFTGRKG